MKKNIIFRRFAALAIDYLVILSWMIFLAGTSILFFIKYGGYPDLLGTFGPVYTQLLSFAMLTLPVGMYFYVTEAGRYHATIGKRRLGIAVHAHKGVLRNKHIAIRTIIKLLPWEIAHTFIWQLQYVYYVEGYTASIPLWVMVGLVVSNILPIVYIAFVFTRKDRRSVHDIISGTVIASS